MDQTQKNAGTKITSPEEFFGFQMGSDKKIARWDRIVEYFGQLGQESDKVKIVDMGPSTQGNPFLLVVISSAENIQNLEELRTINLRLSDPRGLAEHEIETLIQRGKAIVCQSMSLHANEIGGTQMAPELAYDLLSRRDEETCRILENVIFLMFPCLCPDGQIMVTDWYNRWLGTEYEGCDLPWLYNTYAGHDNNRDGFQANLVESQYVNSILFRDWIPQAYVDHHHFGSYGARFYVPPYCEPIHPHADPLVWREVGWYGAHMAYNLEEAGKAGVMNASEFVAWGHLGFHRITLYHNIAGMLTESAMLKLATPLFIHLEQLKLGGPDRGDLPVYEEELNFPHPWPGGWWRLRSIIEQQKIAAWATLDLAARYKGAALRNAYLKAKRQTERGARGNPIAFVIPSDQHDPLTTAKLIRKLLDQGIEIHTARGGLVADGVSYSAGSFVISLAQPKSGLIKTLLGRTYYPDNRWTRDRAGVPIKPKDTATDTMAEFMGVRVEPVRGRIKGNLEKATGPDLPAGAVLGEARFGYILDCRTNDSFTAVNRLLAMGAKVWRIAREVEVNGLSFPPGAFLIRLVENSLLGGLAKELHLVFYPVHQEIAPRLPVRQSRVGIYQRYWGGNADEGWTRLVLEQFKFPYTTLTDVDVKAGNLRQRLDVIILPSDPIPLITGENVGEWWEEQRVNRPTTTCPPEYKSGIGAEGTDAIREFVAEGGTLVTFNDACSFAIEKLGLRVRNVVEDLPPEKFFCPGSTLWAHVDTSHPLGYGMPEDSFILSFYSPAFDVLPSGSNELYKVVVSYPERDILQNGWLIGEEHLKRKAALVAVRYGTGRVILIGFRAQHRAQTHGTFKLLFNALLG